MTATTSTMVSIREQIRTPDRKLEESKKYKGIASVEENASLTLTTTHSTVAWPVNYVVATLVNAHIDNIYEKHSPAKWNHRTERIVNIDIMRCDKGAFNKPFFK